LTRILHVRGDVTGMFLFFTLFFVGLVQIVVAWKRLNGLSLTGYPDRRFLSFVMGVTIAVGSSVWYFSTPGHFAYPDVEGIETLILLVLGLVAALILQSAASALYLRRIVPYGDFVSNRALNPSRLSITVDDSEISASFWPATVDPQEGEPVLLLHDYGGDMRDVTILAESLSARGHAALALDLDGHGENPRGIGDPNMEDLLKAAVEALRRESGHDSVSALGIGLGGTLAIELAARDRAVARAFALDPPAIESTGYPAVNSLRELGPVELIRALLKPGARSATGKRVSLARLVGSMTRPQPRGYSRLTVFGTNRTWFNAPEDLGEYLRLLGVEKPLLLEGNHTSMAFQRKTLEEIDKKLKGSAGPKARQA
jgi:hypothetical protein